MFGRSWRLGRIAGVEVRVDSSWAIIALLVAYSFYLRFAVIYPGLATAAAGGLALLSAILFFGSVLTHEMAHALVAQARGIRVRDITLFLFGGATRARVESRGPGDEFLIAVVGPLTSGLLAVVFGALERLASDARVDPLAGALGYLGWINLLLAGFNLVPGFPLDGGRLLRSTLWKGTGSLPRATLIAARAGQAVGWLLVAGGVAAVAAMGDLVGGLWFALIGWFLIQAARSSGREMRLRVSLHDVRAREVMNPDIARVPPDMPVQWAEDRLEGRADAVPVEEGGHTIGLLTARAVHAVPSEERPTRLVRDVMTPVADHAAVGADTPMDLVLDHMEDEPTARVLVVADGEVIGIITPPDLARWLRRWAAPGRPDL